MDTVFRRGFKTLAEEIAGEVRSDLGLTETDALDCNLLADQLCIPVMALPELAAHGATAEALNCLLHPSARFSAVTVTRGGRVRIAYNPNHATSRRANSLAHELAHMPSIDTCAQTRLHEYSAAEAVLEIAGSAAAIGRECSHGVRGEVT